LSTDYRLEPVRGGQQTRDKQNIGLEDWKNVEEEDDKILTSRILDQMV
jgi:hypothetical protein